MKNSEYEQYLQLIEVLNTGRKDPIIPESKEYLESFKREFLKEV